MRNVTLQVDGKEVEFGNDVCLHVTWDEDPSTSIEAKLTDEGVIIDLLDESGEVIDSWAQMYDDFFEQEDK